MIVLLMILFLISLNTRPGVSIWHIQLWQLFFNLGQETLVLSVALQNKWYEVAFIWRPMIG